MTFENPEHAAFVPKGDDVSATARVLVGLADKHGISQTEIQAANDGFYVSERLADLLGESDGEEVESTDLTDPAGTIARDREQIALAESLAGTHEDVTIEEAPDTATNEAVEDADADVDADEVEDYEEWEYAALKAEVAERGLDTENLKAETLVAALKADDEADETE